MTNLTINNNAQDNIEINGISSISFHHMGNKVFSANQADKIYGVFVSQAIVAPSNFLRWDSFNIDCLSTENIWVYVKNADSNIGASPWVGPYKNFSNNINEMKKSLLQFMVVIKDDGLLDTKIDEIEITYVSSENAKTFFSKTFNIGFRAEHILLTYNADESDDSVLRFAVAGENTIDSSKYQYIEPNKIQELYGIPLFSEKIKLMMEIAGDSGVPLKVHEISFIFGGEKYERINLTTIISSSSDSLSSFSSSSNEIQLSTSSEGYSTSSSSSSEGYSTSSSSSSEGYSTSSSSTEIRTSSSSSEVYSTSSSSSSPGVECLAIPNGEIGNTFEICPP